MLISGETARYERNLRPFAIYVGHIWIGIVRQFVTDNFNTHQTTIVFGSECTNAQADLYLLLVSRLRQRWFSTGTTQSLMI